MGKADLRKYRRALREVMKEGGPTLVVEAEPGRCPDLDEEAAADNAVYVECVDEALRHDRHSAAQRALDRMGEGSYGTCQDCGAPIGEKRLRALPWADRCVRCQQAWERREHLTRAA